MPTQTLCLTIPGTTATLHRNNTLGLSPRMGRSSGPRDGRSRPAASGSLPPSRGPPRRPGGLPQNQDLNDILNTAEKNRDIITETARKEREGLLTWAEKKVSLLNEIKKLEKLADILVVSVRGYGKRDPKIRTVMDKFEKAILRLELMIEKNETEEAAKKAKEEAAKKAKEEVAKKAKEEAEKAKEEADKKAAEGETKKGGGGRTKTTKKKRTKTNRRNRRKTNRRNKRKTNRRNKRKTNRKNKRKHKKNRRKTNRKIKRK